MASTGFQMPPQAPPNFNHNPTSVLSGIRAILDNTRKFQDEIVATVLPEDATFTNVLLPLAEDENNNIALKKLFKFFSSTSTSKELRDASNSSEALISGFDAQTLVREDLFQLINAVFKRKETLDPESQLQFRPTSLQELKVAYLKSLNRSTGIWLTIRELDGFPRDSLASLKTGDGENAGRVWLPFMKPHIEYALRFVQSEATRLKVFVGYDNRCLDNVPRLKKTIILRNEAARLLGFPNYAVFKLKMMMTDSTDFVNAFISDIKERLTPIARFELDALSKLKHAGLGSMNTIDAAGNEVEKITRFHTWDFSFCNNLTKSRDHSFNEKKFSEYFSLERSLAGMMSTFSRLFGLQFIEITSDQFSEFGPEHVMTWHPEVRVFSVWEDSINGGEFLGYLYVDLFPRDHKYNHAGHYNLRPGYTALSGKRQYPASALVMNLSKPLPDQPGLLKHNDARPLFHELGHAIHSQTTRTQYSIFHVTTVRDFGEIPNIMLENWWWTPSVIKEIGFHYSYLSDSYLRNWKESQKDSAISQPPQQLDDEMIQNLMNSRHSSEALATLRRCHLAIFDMTVHSPKTREEVESMNLSEMWNKINSEVTMMEGLENIGGGWEWGHGCARFGAIMRGYDAGYYAYPLGKVYAQDVFLSAFANDPMSREVGMRFRKTVLEPGASQNGMDLLEKFLRRKPNALARYKELNLI